MYIRLFAGGDDFRDEGVRTVGQKGGRARRSPPLIHDHKS